MRYKIDRNHKITRFLCLLLGMILLTGSMCIPVYAAEYWPEGPEVVSPNVIVMEASTGTVLYDCNSLEAHYPASITKIMTTLIALENSDLNDIVTFSDAAIDNTEGSGIAWDYGEQMTMEQCLYAVMLASANECAYAVAEHVGGTIENFVAMMNEKAKELGCQNTHFASPHGLHDENHYTCCYDMALIARAAYQNETFRILWEPHVIRSRRRTNTQSRQICRIITRCFIHSRPTSMCMMAVPVERRGIPMRQTVRW